MDEMGHEEVLVMPYIFNEGRSDDNTGEDETDYNLLISLEDGPISYICYVRPIYIFGHSMAD
jgi:hypothetical protein